MATELDYAKMLSKSMGPMKTSADEVANAIKLFDEKPEAMATLTRAKSALASATELIDRAHEMLR